MDPKKVSIIIPVYNEAAAIAGVVKGLRMRFPHTEIIVVDDGSKDNSGALADQAGAKVLRHPNNRGYGASLKTGVRKADHPFVVFCDGDGQHSTEDIGRLIDHTTDELDMVVGARTEQSHIVKRRFLGKLVLHHFANFLVGETIPDVNSGLRVVKKDVLLKYFHLMPDGFSMSTTTTFAFMKSRRNIAWVPITVVKRMGKSMVSQRKHGPEAMLLMLRLTVLFEPLKVFLTAASALFWLSVISASINLFLSAGQSIGNSTVIFWISAMLVFMFGLLCDQISALRREMHE
jgi:glycosyltransferase involved in cell wall biosynthesis